MFDKKNVRAKITYDHLSIYNCVVNIFKIQTIIEKETPHLCQDRTHDVDL